MKPGQARRCRAPEASRRIWGFVPRAIGSHGKVLSEGGPDSQKVTRGEAAQMGEVGGLSSELRG